MQPLHIPYKEEFHSFFNGLFKQGIEEMLQAELEEHLGYQKHSKQGYNSGNSRNGSYFKKIKTDSLGHMFLPNNITVYKCVWTMLKLLLPALFSILIKDIRLRQAKGSCG